MVDVDLYHKYMLTFFTVMVILLPVMHQYSGQLAI